MGEQRNYHSITESPGLKADREQLCRIVHRYRFAAKWCKGRDVLEVACGTGLGLSMLGEVCDDIVGGDIDSENLRIAHELCAKTGHGGVVKMDAHELPFLDSSFDTLLLFEAIYYLKSAVRFIQECRRVVRPSGRVVLCTVNREWADFHPSPFSHCYYSGLELRDLLSTEFCNVRLYGAFPAGGRGVRAKTMSLVKRAAVRYDLIPGPLKARVYLKRMFLGKLVAIPDRINDVAYDYADPIPIPARSGMTEYKILYAIAGTSS